MEYHQQRLSVARGQRELVARIRSSVEKYPEALDQIASSQQYHAALDRVALRQSADAAIQPLIEFIQGVEVAYEAEFPSSPLDDPILDRVTSLLDGRVGEPFDAAALEAIYKQGAVRYDKKVPPGYEDRKTKEHDNDILYGDLVLWEQLLLHSERKGCDVVFVTDDAKADWWWIEHGQTLGPRPELVQEFKNRTSRRYYQYRALRFLEVAIERGLVESLDPDSVDEIRQLPALRQPTDLAQRFADDPTCLLGGFFGAVLPEPGGTVELDLVSAHSPSARPALSGDILCQVIDPRGRPFDIRIPVSPTVGERVAAVRWPDDFTSGDLAGGGHLVYWGYDAPDGETFVLAVTPFSWSSDATKS